MKSPFQQKNSFERGDNFKYTSYFWLKIIHIISSIFAFYLVKHILQFVTMISYDHDAINKHFAKFCVCVGPNYKASNDF